MQLHTMPRQRPRPVHTPGCQRYLQLQLIFDVVLECVCRGVQALHSVIVLTETGTSLLFPEKLLMEHESILFTFQSK